MKCQLVDQYYQIGKLMLILALPSCNINWSKYAWNQKIPPNIFLIMGTIKDTQNAVIFLDSKSYPERSLVLKVCINKICLKFKH